MNYNFEGRIIYRGKFCLIEVPKSIINYYINVIKQTWGIKLSEPYHGGHITVVDGRTEDASKHPLWGKDHGKKINIEYYKINNRSKFYTGPYWWLSIKNEQDLSNIRAKFQLPLKLFWDFHLTIGYNEQ